MAIEKTVYEHCYCVGYQENSISKILKFFCYKILPDGTHKEFIIYSTDISSIIYGVYDGGYGQRMYICVNGEYQYYSNSIFYVFERFVDSSIESRPKIFEVLRGFFPNAIFTIYEDADMIVINDKLIECIYDRGCKYGL